MQSQEFLKIIGSNDQETVEQAIARMEPWLHRVIHLRLNGGRLRRLADTGDIFQSLIKDFVAKGAYAQPSLEYGPSFKQYLLGAVRNKIRAHLRKERRNSGSLDGHPEPLSREAEPTDEVEQRDLLDAVRNRLSNEDRSLFELRRQCFTWPEITEMVGGQPDSLRMRLRRSVAAAILDLDR
jgi:RNA polymerase sigma factor (sigma-70 family)